MATTAEFSADEPIEGLLTPVTRGAGAVARGPRSALAERMRRRHWGMLWLSVAIVAGALVLQVGASGRVAPDGLPALALPELCGSRLWFGVECPGCGLTRSLIALAAGDLAASVSYNRVGWVMALAVLLQFPYRVWALRELRGRVVERDWPTWFGRALIAALIGSWIGTMSGLF